MSMAVTASIRGPLRQRILLPRFRGGGHPTRPARRGSSVKPSVRSLTALLSVDDLEGLEMTLEPLADTDAVVRISESLAALERGESGAGIATVRQDLTHRRVTGA